MEEIVQQPLTEEELEFISTVGREIREAFLAARSTPTSITIFGSYVFDTKNPYFQKAEDLAREASRLGFTVITGGGPGIMEAGNKGTHAISGRAVGFNIRLPWRAHAWNPFVTHGVDFDYFFNRKIALHFASKAHVFFPGGMGTIDELLEVLILIRNQKTKKVPVVLFGADFWDPFDALMREHLYKKFHTVNESDLGLYKITDDMSEVLDIVKQVAA